MSEELTKSLFYTRIIALGYPDINKDKDGVIVYKEDTFKAYDSETKKLLESASKSGKGFKGTPDFIIKDCKRNIIFLIECKADIDKHQSLENLEEYKDSSLPAKSISNYALDGVLHYSTYFTKYYDVVAVAVSGTVLSNSRITSILIEKGKDKKDLKLLEDSNLEVGFKNIEDFNYYINEKKGIFKLEREKITNELKRYANECNNYLRVCEIQAIDRAGFLSAIVLALTNIDSKILIDTVDSIQLNKDRIGNYGIDLIKKSLQDIWSNKDNLSKLKVLTLDEYYNNILGKYLLEVPEPTKSKYFDLGDTKINKFIFSIYKNIILKLNSSNFKIDVMGTFYTEFLKYAKGDTKDKGIVLTPKHITDLFCDIAEHYLGKNLDSQVKVLDTCTGSGGFLISALERMDRNTLAKNLPLKEKNSHLATIRRECLIGVEKEPYMYALAYANMRFHGDGKSNLWSCSSLIKDDSEIDQGIKLSINLKAKNIDVGMINPPYALKASDGEKKGDKSEGKTELDFIYSMLSYLKKDGIGIAIVPMGCAGSKGEKMRSTILKEHTLLAVMTMPKRLFSDSTINVDTCIMVFKAHRPHCYKSVDIKTKIETGDSVFLARWSDDGFVTIPHNGRYDKNDRWNIIKSEWLNQLKALAEPRPTMYLNKRIDKKDECLAEAYIETDYSKLNNSDFMKVLMSYSLFVCNEQLEGNSDEIN
ncbi:HsdM family class I SAM-dependent methyltransferase [Acinetobacter nosocomialis]|uniref:HsdM family class I SAM-dependent methyltransferase n=1 Tax=Acinetobacter nosocomialis TaxID=106654 RepID=UPI003005E0D7